MSVRKLPSGKWQGQYRDVAGGRHTQVWPTKTAAKQWAEHGQAQVRAGLHRDPRAGQLLLKDWHRRWLAARVVEDATHRADRTYVPWVLEQWASWPVGSITRLEVQGWVRRLQADGRKPSAVAKAVQQLASVLEAAVNDDLIASNPVRGIRLPHRPRPIDRIITAAEERALLDSMPLEQDWQMLEVLLDTALRYGELAGLHGHRVDLLRKELQVVETLTQRGTVKAYPKSRASQRVVPLTDRAVLALSRAMVARGRDDLVFRALRRSPGKTTFGPVVESNWRARAWLPACERAGLAKPWPTPHDTRHTALSRLVAQGVDIRTVQAIAGHESLQTTSRYLHVQPDAHDRVRAAHRRISAQD